MAGRWSDWVEPDAIPASAKVGRLTPTYGSSCKALPVLACRDVHPCKVCRGGPLVIEWTERLTCPDCPGLRCELCGGVGEVAVVRSAECVCESCGGTGVGAIPRGSACTCGVCEQSGKDHLPGLQLSQMERRQIEVDRRMAEYQAAMQARLAAKGGRK